MWLGRRTSTPSRSCPAAVVSDVAGPAVPADEAGDLGPGEAGHLLDEPLHQPLVGSPEPVVLEADQGAAHEGVGGGAVGTLALQAHLPLETGPRSGALAVGQDLYVGQTGLTPEERFQNHRDGYRANRYVRRYGQLLAPGLYEHRNSVPKKPGPRRRKGSWPSDLARALMRPKSSAAQVLESTARHDGSRGQ